MTTHDLKTWPEYFEAVLSGVKSWEYRRDDRPYVVGDVLRLREWEPMIAAYTGRECLCRVTYVARGGLIPAGYVVMSIIEEAQP